MDLGQLDKGRELLHRCLQLAPGHSHACVALALGYQRAGDLSRAKEYTMQAQVAGIPWPSRTWASSSARKATACGLSTICAALWRSIPRSADRIRPRLRPLTGDIEPAQKHFQKVLEMEAPEELRGLARKGLSKIAARELKASGPRMDVVFYLLDAVRLFRGMSLQEIQEITFEIVMLGKDGLDINNPQETHFLRALPGWGFSALQLICICMPLQKRIEPGRLREPQFSFARRHGKRGSFWNCLINLFE